MVFTFVVHKQQQKQQKNPITACMCSHTIGWTKQLFFPFSSLHFTSHHLATCLYFIHYCMSRLASQPVLPDIRHTTFLHLMYKKFFFYAFHNNNIQDILIKHTIPYMCVSYVLVSFATLRQTRPYDVIV